MERRRPRRRWGALLASVTVATSAAAVAPSLATAGSEPSSPDTPTTGIATPDTATAEPLEPIAALEQAIDEDASDPTDLRGADAVEVLEGTGLLDEVAEGAGLTGDELADELLDDPSMFVASTGLVGYVEMFAPGGHDEHDDEHGAEEHGADEHLAAADVGLPLGSPSVPGTGGSGPEPLVTTPQLESNPGADQVLYLDFDGHVTTLTNWTSGPSGPCWDGVSEPFNGSDAAIVDIWERVAEDYLPFDVNVTNRADLDDGFVDQRIVVSPTGFLGGCGVGGAANILGVAFLDTFGGVAAVGGGLVEAPAFAFTGQGFATTKTVAETISHEAGHTFGLRHDGQRVGSGVDEYYFGHNDWAPIMGNPVEQGVTQWSRGEYRCANRTENDLNEIRALVGPRPDDLGTSVPSAPLIAVGDADVGIIGLPAGTAPDVDVFRVQASSGPLTIRVRPVGPSPNLHPRLTVRSAGGSVQAVALPDTPAGESVASFSALAAGTYSVHVEPAAWIGPISGFGEYGSMGLYAVEVEASFTPRTFTLGGGATTFAPALRLGRAPIC